MTDEEVIDAEVLRKAAKDWNVTHTPYDESLWAGGDTVVAQEASSVFGGLTTYKDVPLKLNLLKELKIEGDCNYLINTDEEIQLESEVDRAITLRYKGLKIVISAEAFVYIDITED